MEPVPGLPRRGVLAATVITLTVLPLLVLSNLNPPPATVGVAAAGDPSRVATADGPTSEAGARLGVAVLDGLARVEAATSEILATRPRPHLIAASIIEPVELPRVAVAAVSTTTTEKPRPTTTRAPATTPPPATAAPTTAPPATAAPTTAPPATAPPTTAPPVTTPPTTAPPTTAAPGQTIFGQPYQASWPSIDMWDRLSICEAGGNWSISTGNGYYGGLQFSQSSWEWVGGSGRASDASREEQIYRGNLLWELQGWGAWPGCTRRFGWSSRQTSQ